MALNQGGRIEKAIKVERGIPMPPQLHGGRMKYPWPDMKHKGDSFFVPVNGHGSIERLRNAVAWAAQNQGAGLYSVRLDRQNNGVRVWKIK